MHSVTTEGDLYGSQKKKPAFTLSEKKYPAFQPAEKK